MTQTRRHKEEKETKPQTKAEVEKERKALILKANLEKQFVTLEEMAELAGRKPEEITAYVESEAIPDTCYTYPAKSLFGDGMSIAFFPKLTLAGLETAKAKSKE